MQFSYGATKSIKSALTFGNFDGCHLGHQAVIQRLKQKASALSMPTSILLFEPQPREYFQHKVGLALAQHAHQKEQDSSKDKNSTENNIIRLSSLRDKLIRLKDFGIDFVHCLKFDSSLARCSAENFIHKILFERLQAEYILIGEDARFGFNRTGDAKMLSDAAKKVGKTVEVISNFDLQGMRVSSTLIRKSLLEGQFNEAAKYLGRPYSVIARVAYGKGLGRTIGVPTLNLHVRNNYPPLTGVFAVHIIERNDNIPNKLQNHALCEGRGSSAKSIISEGVANWGLRPTVCGQKLVLEVHGFQLTGNLYGKWVEIIFLQKIRDEKKFASFDSLVQQIKTDIDAAKTYFKESYDRL